MFGSQSSLFTPRVWQVGALCRAVADALQTKFNPVTVRGELSGFSRAASGHCYFALKDTTGQLRCAMFKRSADRLDFAPRDGEMVEVEGRLGVYEPRGDLQLTADAMHRAGVGHLFEAFARLKAKLQAEGLLDAERKRPLPTMPSAIGVVTSLGAAALHDVVSALQRRVPHIPVVIAPTSVQGQNAPAEMIQALSSLYELAELTATNPALPPAPAKHHAAPRGLACRIDLILLVRGGGDIEDLSAFNDEQLARMICRSPVPVVSGVGHETDFTIADFVADLRAPTPTAAAELAALPQDVCLSVLDTLARRMNDAVQRRLETQAQRLDLLASQMGRPSAWLAAQHLRLAGCAQALRTLSAHGLQQHAMHLQLLSAQMPQALQRGLLVHTQRLDLADLRLGLLDPHLVLQRGYAWLNDEHGHAVTSCRQTSPGQALTATLSDGVVHVTVDHPSP